MQYGQIGGINLFEEFCLNGNVAFVIGGGSGIGQAIAIGLSRFGAFVVVGSRDSIKLSTTVDKIAQTGGRCENVLLNIKDRESVDSAVKDIIDKFGKIDILVNSGGAYHKKPTMDVSDEDWGDVIDTNLNGVFRVCRAVGRKMVEQKKGKIINIASLGSFVGLTEATAYCASKAGIVMLTKNLAIEWAQHNIQVNAIAPGVFQTALNREALSLPERQERIINHTPMKRFGKTEELVGTAIYLASSASDFVTGAVIPVDGGFLAWGI